MLFLRPTWPGILRQLMNFCLLIQFLFNHIPSLRVDIVVLLF